MRFLPLPADFVAWAPVISLLLIAVLICFSKIFERNPASVALLISAILWLWTQSAVPLVSDPPVKSALYYGQYLAMALFPPFWTGTFMRFIGEKNSLRLRLELGLFLVTLVFWVVILTDPQTHWFFASVVPSGNLLQKSPGLGYIVFLLEIFLVLGWGIFKLYRCRRLFTKLDRSRAAVILLAVLIPTVFGLLDAFRLTSGAAPLSVVVSGLILLWGIFRARLLEPLPNAHEVVVETLPSPVLVVGSNQSIGYFNLSASGLPAQAALFAGARLEDCFPQIHGQLEPLRQGLEVQAALGAKTYLLTPTAVSDDQSGFQALVLVFHDVTHLNQEKTQLEVLVNQKTEELRRTNQALEEEVTRYRKTQDELEKLLLEKELLIKEVHHRVKNNLQIISSLMNLQSNRLSGVPLAQELCTAMKNRIRTISLVHEQINFTSQLDRVDLLAYLRKLVAGISGMFEDDRVETELRLPQGQIACTLDQATDLGMIVNELLSNAVKHGILPFSRGKITLELAIEAPFLVISVKDSGPGFPDQPAQNSASLGLLVVQTLLKKYKAELRQTNDGGAKAEVRIPWEKP